MKNVACMQSNLQQKSYRWGERHWMQPPKISEQYSWWYAGFCLPTTWSPLKSFSWQSPFGIRSTASFRLRVHTLRFETATWNKSNSPTFDLCDTDDVPDEQHVLFHCVNPHVISLRRKYGPLFPQTGAHDVSTFLPDLGQHIMCGDGGTTTQL